MFEPIGGKPMSVILPKSSESFNKDVIRSFAPSVQRHGLNHCYRDLIVGIDKVKDAATGTTYEFRKNITYKLMPRLLAHLQIDPRLPARPEILFVARKTKHRAFANFDEAVTALTNAFPDYTVKPAHLEDLPMRDQIEAAYKSTLFIGMHGSGLSHLAWMRSTAALVEIMPYKFTCRDWYERATAVSGVQYFKYSASLNETFNPTPSQTACWHAQDHCAPNCSDTLRDQNINLDIPRFVSAISHILKTIRPL